jgi:hypothetical protein
MIGVMTSEDTAPFDSAAADALVAEFEAGTISLDRFHHRQHLAVATWLLLHDAHDVAVDRMRHALQNLLKANGKTDGYDDPLTVRWMRVLADRLKDCTLDLTSAERLNEVVDWAIETRPLSDNRRRDPIPEARISSGSTGE